MNALRQLNDAMQPLFERYPALCGFLVREDLSFTHVAFYPSVDGEEARELVEEIAALLHELVDTQPEAAELLRGRTVARTLH
jgi:hypothetical protein